ncbi:hypothetical protein ACSBR2_039271 [Camellia fascicularis]
MQSKYQEFRIWYVNNHTSQQLEILKQQYYFHLNKYQILRSFPEWYFEFATIMELLPKHQLNVLDDL